MSKIRIVARLRPFLAGESEDDLVTVQRESDGSSTVTVVNQRDQSQQTKFSFSSVYGHASTQEQIYQDDVKPLLADVFKAMTVTVFAYGVTSSGKTHTIQGTKSQPGIIPRVVQDLLARKDVIPGVKVTISMSYMELYKDDCYDLFIDRGNAIKLPIRSNESGQIYVAHLTEMPFEQFSDFDRIYSAAVKRRSTGATNLNRASSRSHAMLTLVVKMYHAESRQEAIGKINLVDLAGSENNKITGNDPNRMAESSAINKSLSVLGQVIHALNAGAPRIPYRDSKLTRLLQDALGGTSIGLLICNLAPGAKFSKDTLNTLNFATRTKQVENRPVANIREVPQPKAFPFAQVTAALATQAPTISSSQSNGGAAPRPSLLPIHGQSRLPRLSGISSDTFQPFALPSSLPKSSLDISESRRLSQQNGLESIGLSKEEIEDRITKAVEREVARRLAEIDQEKQSATEQSIAQDKTMPESHDNSTTEASTSRDPLVIPSGVLTPILKRHQELDHELKERLAELEQKYEKEKKDGNLASIMSPASKKKTGRAYVALARTHSDRGNLQLALELYRKAETYVPENVKLKERIIEIEWAVKHGMDFAAAPKKRKGKEKKRGSKRGSSTAIIDGGDGDLPMDDIEQESRPSRSQDRDGPLGDATNSRVLQKRSKGDEEDDKETLAKKPRRETRKQRDNDDEEEWAPARTPVRKTRAGSRK